MRRFLNKAQIKIDACATCKHVITVDPIPMGGGGMDF